jgi:hypothetical protein
MGYNTEFYGEFKTNMPVDEETYNLLTGLAKTRRMKRTGLPEKYGIDGEYYSEDNEEVIVDHNEPPRTQPGLWLCWEMQEDRQTIVWNGQEKFYHYSEWIEYIIEKILKPRGYILNGNVEWRGEDSMDTGNILVVDNTIRVCRL